MRTVVLLLLVGGAAGGLLDQVLRLVSSRTTGREGVEGLAAEFRWEEATYRLRLVKGVLQPPRLRLLQTTAPCRREGGEELAGRAVVNSRLRAAYVLAEVESLLVSSGRVELDWEGEVPFRLRAEGVSLRLHFGQLEAGFTKAAVQPNNAFYRTPIYPERLEGVAESLGSLVMESVRNASANIGLCEAVVCSLGSQLNSRLDETDLRGGKGEGVGRRPGGAVDAPGHHVEPLPLAGRDPGEVLRDSAQLPARRPARHRHLAALPGADLPRPFQPRRAPPLPTHSTP